MGKMCSISSLAVLLSTFLLRCFGQRKLNDFILINMLNGQEFTALAKFTKATLSLRQKIIIFVCGGGWTESSVHGVGDWSWAAAAWGLMTRSKNIYAYYFESITNV